jgi:hypothetical protein
VIEVRRQTGNDQNLCDKGVLIYTVDGTIATLQGPMQVVEASVGTNPTSIQNCAQSYAAPFDVGPGEVAQYVNATDRLTVDVVGAVGEGYRVRVRRQ